MKFKVAKSCSCLAVAAILLFGLAAVNAADAKTGALQKIDDAVTAGTLSYEEGVLYKVYTIRSPEKIPEAYRPEAGIIGRCATPIIREAREGMSGFSPDIQAGLTEALARPSRTYTFDSPGGYFKIHYDTEGAQAVPTADNNSNGTPDYVENIAAYADSSWEHQIYTLGWRQPPSDNGNGGDNLYDIYTESMPYYGYTDYDAPGPEPWNDYISYISVHKNFIGFPPNDDPEGDQKGAAKVTVAHEFNHACQLACDGFNEDFFFELSAVYAEEKVFDVVNDCYNYLGEFFSAPYVSLRESSFHMYSTFIFGLYLDQNYGPSIMPEIWEYIRYESATSAIYTALADYGTTFADEFPLFTAWNYLTGYRDDGFHHEEAGAYPYVTITYTENSYPVTRTQTAYNRPQGWAANYAVFNPGGPANKILCIDFNGQNYTEWAFPLILHHTSGENEIVPIIPDPVSGDTTIYVPFFPDLTYVVGVPTSLVATTNSANYVYTATLLTPGDLNEDSEINPIDAVILVNYVYKYGTGISPEDFFGDCNCDGEINPLDVVILVNHVYKGADEPCT